MSTPKRSSFSQRSIPGGGAGRRCPRGRWRCWARRRRSNSTTTPASATPPAARPTGHACSASADTGEDPGVAVGVVVGVAGASVSSVGTDGAGAGTEASGAGTGAGAGASVLGSPGAGAGSGVGVGEVGSGGVGVGAGAGAATGARGSGPGGREYEGLAGEDQVGVAGRCESVAVGLDDLLPVRGDLGRGRRPAPRRSELLLGEAPEVVAARRPALRPGPPGRRSGCRWRRRRRVGGAGEVELPAGLDRGLRVLPPPAVGLEVVPVVRPQLLPAQP